MQKIREEICQFVSDMKNIEQQEVDFSKDLNELGISSFDFVKLAVHLEEIFDVEFDDERLSRNLFRNLTDLESYMAQLALERI